MGKTKQEMKLIAAFAALASAKEVVTDFCGFNLEATYGVGLNVVYYKTKRKLWENRDPEKIAKKPRGPSHWRDVVRVECGPARKSGRPQNEVPLGGYPVHKLSPMIKCTRKGPNGAQNSSLTLDVSQNQRSKCGLMRCVHKWQE